jgi:hypothetical protein
VTEIACSLGLAQLETGDREEALKESQAIHALMQALRGSLANGWRPGNRTNSIYFERPV